MTVKLSNLQFNALRLFSSSGKLSLEEFQAIYQSVVSGLGRRKIPLIRRVSEDQFVLTAEAKETLKRFDESDVFRKIARTSVAKIFDHSGRYPSGRRK